MTSAPPRSAPPVVAVVVAHEPGPWFDESLAGLAAQDYPNLRVLVLLTGEDPETQARVEARLPEAIVRAVPGNVGFGPTANEVLRLVEGESGFFCFLHDDVALDPPAIRLLVEELYRSNAGVVGPKLVEWDDPTALQHVGLAIDRVGEVDPLVEPGELDQEQHDAVTDVFCVPSACLLVRADLFRAIGGFDADIDFYGDDLDLCWRAHLGGARVLVVPAARARHREQLPERRPDLDHRRLAARHRVGTVTSLSGAKRLPIVTFQLLIVSAIELVIGLFTGSARDAWASLAATFGLIPRTGSILSRRTAVRELRRVPDREVVELQMRGSARWAAFSRSREAASAGPTPSERRGIRENVSAALAIWAALLFVLVVGSRGLITGGVARIGEFLPFPASPLDLAREYLSGWRAEGIGQPAPQPTGLLLIGLSGVLTLGNMGLLHTLSVVGLLFVGALGVWRLCSVFPTTRAQVGGLVVYAAVPLAYQDIAAGSWSGLAVLAALPWTVHLLGGFAGLAPVRTVSQVQSTETDVVVPVERAERIRLGAGLAIVAWLAGAFVPVFGLLALVVALLLAAATLLAGGRAAVAGWYALGGVVVAVGGFALNLPWSLRFLAGDGWTAMVGLPLNGPRDLGLLDLAKFSIGSDTLGVLALGLYVPVIAGLLLARSWRFTWAMRGALLVTGFLLLAVLADTTDATIAVPNPTILLAPVALGLALSSAAALGSLGEDVRGAAFGWRQPLGLLTVLAVGLGVLPFLVDAVDGRWGQPPATLDQLLQQLPADPPEGDYRVLYVGDPRVLPVPGWEYEPGIGYAISPDGPADISQHWTTSPREAEDWVADALEAIATGSTDRGGTLLGPLGIRFIVVPIVNGSVSTVEDPLAPPDGLIDALGDQLDLRRKYQANELQIFENTAWIPTQAALSGPTAEASTQAGAEALVRADLNDATPVLVGAEPDQDESGPVPDGTIAVAVPPDDGWSLTVEGEGAPSRPAFGLTTAFDVPTGGQATLSYDTSLVRPLIVVLQLVVWALVLMLAFRRRWAMPTRRRRPPAEPTEPLVDLDEMVEVPLP